MYSFCFDVFLFHVPYTTMQYAGLGFLFSLYLFQGLKFALWDLSHEKRREAAIKAEVEKVEKALQEAHTRSILSNAGAKATAPATGTGVANRA